MNKQIATLFLIVVLAVSLPLSSVFAFNIDPDLAVELVNKERESRGLTPLKISGELSKAALEKATDLAQKGRLEHTLAVSGGSWSWILKQGYNYAFAGENLAVGVKSTEDLIKEWMNSPTHRANILNEDFADIGIGLMSGYYAGGEAEYVVQYSAVRKSEEVPSVQVQSETEQIAELKKLISGLLALIQIYLNQINGKV